MRGLLLKDFHLMKVQKSFFIVILVVACIMSISMDDPAFIIGFLTSVVSLFTVSTISYDEFDNGYPFLLTLPFSRKTYVKEKYVYGLILGSCSCVISTIIATVMMLWKDIPLTSDLYIVSLAMIPVVLLIEAIMIPLHIKFGSEKGRYALIGVIGTVVVLGLIIKKIIDIFHINVLPVISFISSIGFMMFMFILILIALAFLFVSMQISIKIMYNKEF